MTAEGRYLKIDKDELPDHCEDFVIVSPCGEHFTFQNITFHDYFPEVTLVGGTGNEAPEYLVNTGRYCTIGKLVFVDVLLCGDAEVKGKGTGVIHIALPVISGASSIGNGIGISGLATNNGENHILHGNIDSASNTVYFERWSSIKILVDFVGYDQGDHDRTINLHFWYEVD